MNGKELDKAPSLTELQKIRDPMSSCSFGAQIEAVFGYSLDSFGVSLIYFWQSEIKSLSWGRRRARREYDVFIKFGLMLSAAQEQNPNMKGDCSFLGVKLEHILGDSCSFLDPLELYWCEFGKMKFVCLYRIDAGRSIEHGSGNAPKAIKHDDLMRCLTFHYDYFFYRSPILNAVPMRYLFSLGDGRSDLISAIHLDPKCFQPFADTPEGAFLWPWQASIFLDSRSQGLSYRPLRTVSLVFDLRKSTIAMEELDDVGLFSPFLTKVIGEAREIVFEYGGYFDRQTGDGLVCHFIDFRNFSAPTEIVSAEKRAFEAAVAIIRNISRLCEQFQTSLRHGIAALSGSVGLHVGDSVWIVERNYVRAVGDSVIYAARLCAEAEPRMIFVSNRFYHHTAGMIGAEVVSRFQRKNYGGKKFDKSVGAFGYAIVIADVI